MVVDSFIVRRLGVYWCPRNPLWLLQRPMVIMNLKF